MYADAEIRSRPVRNPNLDAMILRHRIDDRAVGHEARPSASKASAGTRSRGQEQNLRTPVCEYAESHRCRLTCAPVEYPRPGSECSRSSPEVSKRPDVVVSANLPSAGIVERWGVAIEHQQTKNAPVRLWITHA